MIVYFHRNPKTFEVFYVGIGTIKRSKDFSPKGRNVFWHRYVKKYGRPIVQVVHENIPKNEAITWEIHYNINSEKIWKRRGVN